jgi:nicotinamide-nucleotide amidase
VPVRGGYLENSNGSAVGLVFEMEDRVIVALPGPPRELQAMVRDELIPYLSRRFGTRLPGCSLTLRFVGLGQSQIDATLEEHVRLPPGVTLSSQFEGFRVDFTFSLPDDTPQDRARLETLKEQILRRLGDYVYAADDTSLEEHVVGRLAARGERLALAEVGSGGSLAAALGASEAAGDVLAGAFVAPTDEALRGLFGVSDEAWAAAASGPEKTRLLASAAAERTGSDWTTAVGQSQPDSSGSRYVEVVFRRPDGDFQSQRFPLRGGDTARSRLVTQLLDQLRRRLR